MNGMSRQTDSPLMAIRNDQGVGMILVIGISLAVSLMIATAAVMTVNTLGQSKQRTQYEQSLAAAEYGIDSALAHLQAAYDASASDYPIPAPGNEVCDADVVDLPDFAGDEAAEEAWARSQIETLANNDTSCVHSGTDGDYTVLKPEIAVTPNYQGYGTVYAMGWSPSRGAGGATERLVKNEYVFLPWEPGFAILAADDLVIDSSTYVSTVSGSDPSLAAVHSNGTVSTNGNPTVYGEVSSTESSTSGSTRFYANPDGNVTSQPEVSIPTVSARQYYFQADSTRSDWYDLCHNGGSGEVREYGSSGPCTGTVIPNGPSAIGWSYDGSSRTWTISRNSVSGTFFAHEADINNGTGNASFANMTVIASALSWGDCATKSKGNIDYSHYDIAAPATPHLFMMADSDIKTHSNFTAGNTGTNGSAVQSGLFTAGDQIWMQTSSQGAVGSVLAAEQCDPGGSEVDGPTTVKNPAVYYDPNADSPFTSIIRTTLWLEY